MRRWLCSRRHSFWILLVLLVVFIAIQTFVARQARNDKQTGLPHLSFPVNKQFSTLQNVWADPNFEASLVVKQEVKSLHTEKTSDLYRNEGKTLNKIFAAGPQMEAQNRLPGQLLLPKLGNKSSLGILGSLFPHNSRKAVISAPGQVTCKPESHIVFLKTHKTASSTILNILYRYGEGRNLTFALPLNKHSQLFYPFFFASHFVEGVNSRSVTEFHIMCNHMRFRKSEVAKVMPRDTFYFSILRHPVMMMESIFFYFKSIPAFHKTSSLEAFLDSSWSSYNASATNNHYAHNILAFDFGFDNNVTAVTEDLEARAKAAVATIERDFNLILISEYFDESMVLLRHALCWSLEDVVSFRLNSRSEKTRHSLLPETTEKIKWWNALDWRIYLHFNATFWHKVDSLVGRDQMKKEVSQLKDRQAKLANTCLKDGRAVDPSQVKDARLKPFQYGAAIIQGYNLKPDLDAQTKTKCHRIITPELQYTDRLYNQQFPDIAARHRVVASEQRQHSGRTAVMGMIRKREALHRQIIRRNFSIPRRQKASTSALVSKVSNTEAKNNTRMP